MPPLDDVNLHLVESWDDGQDLLAWLGQQRNYLGSDIETTGLNVGRDDVRLVQFGDATDGWALDYSKWRGLVEEVFSRYDRAIAFHNGYFDLRFLTRDGIHVPHHLVHDTMIAAHLLDPRYSIALKNQAARHVDKRAKFGQEALGEAFRKAGWNFGTVPTSLEAYWLYSALDTSLTSLLAEKLMPKIAPYQRVYDVEMACLKVLVDAGIRGMKIDLDYVESKRAQYLGDLANLASRVPFKPSKDRDAVDWLLQQGAHLTVKTEKGAWSVDDEVLESLESSYPEVIVPLREWRKKSRIVSSYLDNFLEMNVDGFLYPSVKTVGARTGRMSVTEPALQTLPRGTAARDAFISREGHTLLLADYEQAELRVLASFAQEQAMIDAFARGEDLHDWVACLVNEVDIEGMTPQMRQVAKNVQFARGYGAGEAKLAITAGVDIEVIKSFLIKYNELFPGISEFMEATVEQVMTSEFEEDRKFGYVHTILGRRLPVEKAKAYTGANYIIQPSATADLLKLKLVELANAGLNDYILLPVHDEILFEVPDDDLEAVRAVVEEVMPETKLFGCPITIETSTTKRWGDKYKKFGELGQG